MTKLDKLFKYKIITEQRLEHLKKLLDVQYNRRDKIRERKLVEINNIFDNTIISILLNTDYNLIDNNIQYKDTMLLDLLLNNIELTFEFQESYYLEPVFNDLTKYQKKIKIFTKLINILQKNEKLLNDKLKQVDDNYEILIYLLKIDTYEEHLEKLKLSLKQNSENIKYCEGNNIIQRGGIYKIIENNKDEIKCICLQTNDEVPFEKITLPDDLKFDDITTRLMKFSILKATK